METKKLLMFSCGMDSTYLAWKFLTDKTQNLHLHHISLRARTPLWKEQDVRVESILSYLRKIHPFEYSESRFDYDYPHPGWDSDVCLIMAQKVCQGFSHFKHIEVYMGWNPSDMKRRPVAERAERNVTPNLWKALVQSARNWKFIDERLHFPLIKQNITKAEIIKEMPKDLTELTFSCREGDPDGCGHCMACKDIEEAYGNC